MKYSSEFLFDHPASRYEPEQTKLADKKTKDGKLLLKKLAKQRAHGFDTPEIAQETIFRYQKVEKAIEFWESVR